MFNMNDEVSVAVIALIVAGLALFNGVAQLLQSIFGNVQGYRRCKEPVIGPWASRTHRIWLWTECRFQTRFVTPNIRLAHVPIDPENGRFDGKLTQAGRPGPFILLPPTETSVRNLHYSRELIRTTVKPKEDSMNEELGYEPNMVTWLSLLRSVSQYEKVATPVDDTTVDALSMYKRQYWALYNWPPPSAFQRKASVVDYVDKRPSRPRTIAKDSLEWPTPLSHRTRSVVSYVERAWDLLPAGVVRPFAQSTVGTLIVLAHRLGMQWRELLPMNGFLRAEGNGQSLTSTMVQGLGLLFEFKRDFNAECQELPTLIACEEADRLSCGIVPSIMLGVPGRKGDKGHLRSSLQSWGIEAIAVEKIIGEDITYEGSTLGAMISSFIALTTPYLPVIGSNANRVIWPYYATGTLSLFRSCHARDALRQSIRQEPLLATSARLQRVRYGLKRFFLDWPDDYRCNWPQSLAMSSPRDLDKTERFLNFFRDEMAWVRETFSFMFGNSEQIAYSLIMKNYLASISTIADAKRTRAANIHPDTATSTESVTDRAGDQMRAHLEYLHQHTIPELRQKHPNIFKDDASVVVAWYIMVYRAICWIAPLDIDTANSPSAESLHSYYGSDMPVYIG